ncbi:MAG: LLM class F420-dependent oxidoreductase [Ilumatobacteraceae bacterium]
MQPISGTGVWAASLRYGDPASAAEAVAELESLGYNAAWIPDVGGDLFAAVENLMQATNEMTIATGILNLWMHTPDETADQHARLSAEHGDRFMVGIGVSHAPLIDRNDAGRYAKPLAKMTEFLDGLDAASTPLAAERRMLAALGPKMLALAGERTAGSHPYLVTPELTAAARSALGPDKVVASEQAVVLDTDPVSARATARGHLSGYIMLPNYSNNWKRNGFTDDDLANGGSDRLVDSLVVWGDEQTILDRVQAHRDAGADHVCIQALNNERIAHSMDQWRALAPVLLG